MYEALIFFAGIFAGLLIAWMKDYHKKEVKIPFFDQEEFHENCTVHVLMNSKTGDTSIGWWYGSVDDMPIVHIENNEDEDDE